jgi:hypothetical protein
MLSPANAIIRSLASRDQLTASFDLLYANIPVSDKLFGVIAAAVDLQADSSGVGMAFLGFGPFHELDSINPGC